MLNKNLVLGSVASLALAVAASPAFAQSPPQYPDHSLPWEYAETAQLNAQQAAMPGIIASNTVVTSGTSAVVASNNSAADIEAYNAALAAQQSAAQQAAAQQAQYQQQWSDYQQKLADYNAKMAALRSSAVVAAAPVASETVVASAAPVVSSTVIASGPVVTSESVGAPVVRERIIHRPIIAQETVTRPVVTQETFTRPVVHQETFTRPVTHWETFTRDVVRNETVTRPVVTQETFTRPVMRDQIVREQVIDRPIVRQEVVGTRETVIAENTPVTDEWVRIYPHHERLVVFSTIPSSTSMSGAQVMDSSGQVVGTFNHMTVQNGVPAAVITLNDNRTIAVSNDNLRYDPTANIVVADLSYSQMDAMPAFG
jgi:hypothetical protein